MRKKMKAEKALMLWGWETRLMKKEMRKGKAFALSSIMKKSILKKMKEE
jgi:hypothetical protein